MPCSILWILIISGLLSISITGAIFYSFSMFKDIKYNTLQIGRFLAKGLIVALILIFIGLLFVEIQSIHHNCTNDTTISDDFAKEKYNSNRNIEFALKQIEMRKKYERIH